MILHQCFLTNLHTPNNFPALAMKLGGKNKQKKQAYVLQYAVHCIDMVNTTQFCKSAQILKVETNKLF